MAEITYRLGVEADFPDIARLYEKLDRYYREYGYFPPEMENVSQIWLDSFRRTLGRYSMLFVAELDGVLVGFILSRLKRTPPYRGGLLVGELSDMWIEPAARRMGAGEKLTRLELEWMRAEGVHSVEGQVLLGNEPIWRIYQRMGFKQELVQIRLRFEDLTEEQTQAGG